MRCLMRLSLSVALVALGLACATPANAADSSPVGRKIDNFTLHDFRGAEQTLAGWSERPLVVVAFLGTECPVAKLAAPRLVELAAAYQDRGVQFIGIDSNQQDSLAEMAKLAKASRMEFPFLKDPGNVIADRFGAARTPQVFVLDKERVVRYTGRIDDQHAPGASRVKAQRRELATALEELLAGKTVTTPETAPAGCHIGRVNRKPPTGTVTYSTHIAKIFHERCVACHRPGEIGPFSLTSYADVEGWTSTIREVVEQQRMPPWHANPQFGHFQNDSRLSADEKRLLLAWIDNGAPEGDPADTPPLPEFVEGWQIPKPDIVVSMAETYDVADKGTVPYQYFAVDREFPEETWISAAEARPGNAAVVHHLILFYLPAGGRQVGQEAALSNSLAVFSPGMPPWVGTNGIAKRIPAGARLFFQVHYTPNGSEQTDLSRAGLVLVDPKTVKQEILTEAAVETSFRIPPRVDTFRGEANYRMRQDMQLVSLLPHMHLRGKSFRFEAVFPDGKRETLLDVPRYDFNWQNNYILKEPLLLPEGTVLHCDAAFDNSAQNPVNPDPDKEVGWGDQTWEEMLVGSFQIILADQDLRLGRPQAKKLSEDEYEVEFRYKPTGPAEAVYLAGSFNEWKPDGHKMDGPDQEGRYSTRLKLKPGEHEYKFVIDGKTWRHDPGNPDRKGTYHNSVLRVGGR